MPYSETWAEHYPDGTVIPYMDKKAREAIGEGYNPPYSAGQAIMYEGITYVANTAIASDEIWTPSHWIASNVCAMYNELKSNLIPLENRMQTGNKNSAQAIIDTVSQTTDGSMSILTCNASMCDSLGGGNESGMLLCKYFPSSNVINYAVIGSQVAIGKINTTNGNITKSSNYPDNVRMISVATGQSESGFLISGLDSKTVLFNYSDTGRRVAYITHARNSTTSNIATLNGSFTSTTLTDNKVRLEVGEYVRALIILTSNSGSNVDGITITTY